MKPSGEVVFGRKATRETWSPRQESNEGGTRQGGAPTPLGAPSTLVGPSWAPRGSPDVFLPPIYTNIP